MLTVPEALEKIGSGTLCVLSENEHGKIYGRTITVADRLSDDRVIIAKWIRRLTNWSGRQAPLAVWNEKIVPLVEKKLAQQKTPVVRFTNHPHKIVAQVSLAELTMRVPVDSHGVALWKPIEREVLPSDCARCSLVPICRELPTATGVALLWRRLGLVEAGGAPTQRGQATSFFSEGDGLAVAAALEDEKYPLAELIYEAAAVVLLGVLAPSARPGAAAGDVLPFKATERTLANGLKVIVVPTGFPNLVSIEIPVQVGSRNEVEPGKSGFAHFFEHLMFRGTPTTPPDKYHAIMSAAGARDNASTGNDRTHFYATFAKEHLESLIALYGDMFQHLAYSEADFKTEARAILGEYNKNSADPTEKLFEVQRDRFYQAHTYKHTTMGFISDIENMPNEYAYSKVFFERWYRPQYTTVIVAGDVTPDQVMPLVEKYFGSWKGGAAAPVEIPKEPAPTGPRYAHVPWSSTTLPYVSVGFPGPAFVEAARSRRRSR